MGEMQLRGGADKWQAPRQTPEKPKVQTDEEDLDLSGDPSEKPVGLTTGGETALEGAGEIYDAQAKKFDTMDFVLLTAEENLKAYLEATLSNPAILSRIIKEVDPDIEGFKRTMSEAMLPTMKMIQKNFKPGEGMRDAILALDEQFQDRLSRLRRGTKQPDEKMEQPLRRRNRP